MVKKLILSLVALFWVSQANAQEGMWIPSLLEQLNESEMQAMGMKMDASDIYNVNQGSLKDAIVHFGGFCTGEIISKKGLVLTNHHCGYSAIQSHSTVENNLLENGFWAMNTSEELPNEGLFVRFIEEIQDVTDLILNGVDQSMTEKERSQVIQANIKTFEEQFDQLSEFEAIEVKSFYKGNQFYAFKTVRYNDIRLVGAPPSSIGKFGADTDNWVWPRHTGDFALFRIYAGPNNEPANYSEENIPFVPKHHLPVSLDGVQPGDFTMVFGFPGSTDEYLPAIAVEQLVEDINPARIEVRDRSLKVLDAEMKADPAVKIQYASKFASIANYWKKWQGENLGLSSTGAVENIRMMEEDFQKRIKKSPSLKETYAHTLDALEEVYRASLPYRKADAVFSEIISRNIEGLRVAGYIKRLVEYYDETGEEAYSSFKGRLQPYLVNLYKDYNGKVDQKVAVTLMKAYEELMDEAYHPDILKENSNEIDKVITASYSASGIASGKILEWLNEDAGKAVEHMRNDPLVILFSEFRTVYEDEIRDGLIRSQAPLDSLQRHYMKGQMEVFMDDHRIYPDANSSLRVSYGQVNGYAPRDGMKYLHQTYLDGVMQKYVPGDYEFDVPERLIELYEQKDFGAYAEDGKIPVCFIGSNHTTGGNSGSPAIDAHGNLIGLNFDRVWEGTMSDYYYDLRLCRNIMVDARYILFIIDKFAGAGHLIEEMDLVHPKTMD
jgi:hypothetical protein